MANSLESTPFRFLSRSPVTSMFRKIRLFPLIVVLFHLSLLFQRRQRHHHHLLLSGLQVHQITRRESQGGYPGFLGRPLLRSLRAHAGVTGHSLTKRDHFKEQTIARTSVLLRHASRRAFWKRASLLPSYMNSQ